jgi:hypothetical protein
MPTWIVAHTAALCNYFLALQLGFSAAQQRHALNVIEALLVCPAKHKTLAALTRLLRLPHADEYALADFFRVSPWQAATVRTAVLRFLLAFATQVQRATRHRLLFVSVDDSLCRKHARTRALEAVGWHHDHNKARRQLGHCTNASCYVTLHLQLGLMQLPLNWRLYLKRSQVTALNRARRGTDRPRLMYQGLAALVMEMLDEIAPHLPTGCRVYVLFDAWYDNHKLQQFIRAHGWHWLCASRSNRRVGDFQLGQWWSHLGHQRCERIPLRLASRSHIYLTRHTVGRLRRYPGDVVALISKRARRDTQPAYFLCSDTALSVRCIVKYYSYRWQAEVDNWFLKERLGLADFRLRPVEAIANWHALVFVAYAFVAYRRALPLLERPLTALAPLAEVLAAHRQFHARQTVVQIASLVRTGYTDAQLLAELFPT